MLIAAYVPSPLEVIPVSSFASTKLLPLLAVPMFTPVDLISIVFVTPEFLIVEAAFTVVSEFNCTSFKVAVSLMARVPVNVASIVSSLLASPFKVTTAPLPEKFIVLLLYDF